MAELNEVLSRLHEPTIDDMNVIAQAITNRRNNQANDDFCGLSPALMVRFLHFPFESPDVIELPSKVPEPAIRSKLTTFFSLLVAAIGENGVKSTVAGNLPLSVVRAVAAEALTAEELLEMTRFGVLRTETNFSDLHATRLIAEMSGMVRKLKGRFVVTKACQQLQARSGLTEIYPRLFRGAVQKFNWDYESRFPQPAFLQNSYAFTLYLLSLYGNEWRAPSFYEDLFLKAFPRILDEIPTWPHETPEDAFRSSYTYRAFTRNGLFLGLVETKSEKIGHFLETTAVRKTSLLDAVVRFHV